MYKGLEQLLLWMGAPEQVRHTEGQLTASWAPDTWEIRTSVSRKGWRCGPVGRVLAYHAGSTGWVGGSCLSSKQEVETEESEVQGHPWFRTELQASLGHKLLSRKKLLTRKVWGALSWLINKHCTHSVSPGVWGGPHSQYRRRRPLQSDPWWPWVAQVSCVPVRPSCRYACFRWQTAF